MAADRDTEARLEWLEQAVILLSSVPGAPKLPPRPGGEPVPATGFRSDAVPSEQVPEEVLAFLRAGKTIHAVKAYREATGAGLKEAKDEIDRLRQMGFDR